MAIKTYTEQLEEVQTAISNILSGGQGVQYNGRKMDLADIGVLEKMETRLRAKVARENGKLKRSKAFRITQL